MLTSTVTVVTSIPLTAAQNVFTSTLVVFIQRHNADVWYWQ